MSDKYLVHELRPKRKYITYDVKKEIIEQYKKGATKPELVREYGFRYSTIVGIIKRADSIMRAVKNVPPPTIVPRRYSVPEIIMTMETILIAWCKVNFKKGPLDPRVVKEKASQIFDQLLEESEDDCDFKDFIPSDRWFVYFRKRYKDAMETAMKDDSTDDETVPLSFPDKLNAYIRHEGYCDQTMFNVRETHLFWKQIPKMKSDDDPYEDGVFIILGGNAAGDCKLKPVVVHHTDPKELNNKSKSNLPVIWKTDPKSTVTASIFKDWFVHHFIPEAESYCYSQNIPFKVILLLQISSAHPPVSLLGYDPRVRIVYIAPEVISLQPLDQGIITAFKGIYVRELLETIGFNIEEMQMELEEFNILNAVTAIAASWSGVSRMIMNTAWKSLCPELVQHYNISTNDLIEEIVTDFVDDAARAGLTISNEEVLAFLNASHVDYWNEVPVELIVNYEPLDRESDESIKVGTITGVLERIEDGNECAQEIDDFEE